MIKVTCFRKDLLIPYPEKDIFSTIESTFEKLSGINKKYKYLLYCKGEILKVKEFKRAKEIEKILVRNEDTGKSYSVDSEIPLNDKEKEELRQYLEGVLNKIENKIESVKFELDSGKRKKEDSEYKKLYQIYIQCCEKYPSEKPTVRRLELLTKNFCSRSKWNKLFNTLEFCDGLIRELNKKINYHHRSKEKQDFWTKKLQDFVENEYKISCDKFAERHIELKTDIEYTD